MDEQDVSIRETESTPQLVDVSNGETESTSQLADVSNHETESSESTKNRSDVSKNADFSSIIVNSEIKKAIIAPGPK